MRSCPCLAGGEARADSFCCEQKNLITFVGLKSGLKQTAAKAHERSNNEKVAELLVEICCEVSRLSGATQRRLRWTTLRAGFYSWYRERGRHAHIWLVLASPTVKDICTTTHKQCTYVFRKDHPHEPLSLAASRGYV